MMHLWATALLVLGFLALSVGAGRTGTWGLVAALEDDEKGGAEEVRELFIAEANSICGGHRIRQMLTQVASDASFRCSKWTSIEAEAAAYLTTVDTEIKRLVKEVARLDAAIEHAREKSAPQTWDIQGSAKPLLESIFIEAFTTEKSKPPLGAVAGKAQCGKAGWKKRKELGVPSGTYNAAVELMKVKLEEVFKPGETRVGDGENEALLNVCAELTGWDQLAGHDKNSYCDELCTAFASEAVSLSGEYGGSYAGPGVVELQELRRKAVVDLTYNQDEEGECKRARASLEKFSAELVALNKDISVKHELRMQAQDRLDEAEGKLEQMETEKGSMEQGLAKAKEDLGLSEARVKKLDVLLIKAAAAQATLTAAVKTATEALEGASAELARAEQASAALDAIRGLVSQSLLRMWAYFEIVIVNPVLELGLESAKIEEEYFQKILATDAPLDEKQGVFDTLIQMDEFCANTANAAFAKVKATVDLTPICSYGQAHAVSEAVEALVKARATAVKQALRDLQAATEPYRGQEGMSEEEAKKLMAQGEPDGLRKIATVFAESSYYSKYAAHWRVDAEPPKFLELLAKLRSALANLAAQESSMKAALQHLKDAAAAQAAAAKQVAGELKEAIAQKEVNQAKAKEAEELLAAQEAAVASAEDNLDELERLLMEAEKAYEDAKVKLTETHKMGTNLK